MSTRLLSTLHLMGRTFVVLSALPCLIVSAAELKIADEISQSMQDRDYAKALVAIDKGMAEEDTPRQYLLYLKGRAYHHQERYEEAVRTFDLFEKLYPDDVWARRVRFAKAVSLARMNGFLQAEQIYRQEAEYLLSDDRKLEIAETYIEFADLYFEPEGTEKKPEYQKALEFYNKALEVAPASEQRTVVELRAARCLQELGQFDEAITRLRAITDQHPDHVEARFRLGECYFGKSQLVEARRTWQDLIRDEKESDSPLIAEAAYKIGATHGMPSPSSRSDLNLGIVALRTFVLKYPGHELAARALSEMAQAYRNQGQLTDAVEVLLGFLDEDRYRERDEYAAAQFALGECYQAQEKFDEAIAAWKDYLVKHPSGNRWADAQRLIVDTEFLVAQQKHRDKKHGEARNRYEAFLAQYPLDGRAAQILYQLGQMQFEQENWQAAISDWRRLVSKYPQAAESSNAQYMIASIHERQLDKLEEAIEEYKKVVGGRQPDARRRINQLTRKSLQLRTDRVFRSNEKPSIALTTRNIENVTVKSYRIDLETYFRKMHLATGVESLDIALIDPDETFEHEVTDYAKYKQFSETVEIPAFAQDDAESSVQVVTVSSDDMEATTMVIQSDLEIVVKSSRDELFVFAQNMRTGRPWKGARLLISDGSQVIAEGVTNDDGILQSSYDELRGSNDVRVFAISNEHTASNTIGLNGLGVAQGLADKGYIYTDRSTYRPGQLVNLRGVIRRVANDTFVIDEGKRFDLTILDPRNRPIWEEEVQLNAFGSFHGNFVLPPSSPQGNYRMLVAEKKGDKRYQGAFSVQTYNLQKIQLAIESDRNVYYRGEKIRGKVVAKYYYGAPVVDRTVRYTLQGPNARQIEAQTNDAGEVEFEFETRDFQETQTLALVATLPEFNLNVNYAFVLATHGYSLSARTGQSVYLADESFEVTVNAVDAEGEPAAREVTLKAFKETNVDGKTGERLVTTQQLKTDAEQGVGRVSVALREGGSYNLRVEGTDRFGNPITGQSHVQISDKDDRIRLRILASQHSYKVGDTATATIHWREEPTLALLTHQGARVLDYKLLQLKNGANKIEMPMTAKLAPNFDLDVVVMTDSADKQLANPQRLHTATSSFNVQRDLVVRIETDVKGEAEPGQKVRLKVIATDPQGKPAKAELSLAMIEESLLDRFGSAHVGIGDFFHVGRRQSAVRTNSSIQFRYQPETRKINSRLLAEEDRLAIEDDERISLEALASDGATAISNGIVVTDERFDYDADSNSDRGVAVYGGAMQGQGGQMAPMGGGGMGGGGFASGYVNAPGESAANYSRGNWARQKGAQMAANWDELSSQRFEVVGGEGSITPFPGNLSLAISQTQSADFFGNAQFFQNISPQLAANGVTAVTKDGTMVNFAMADLQGRRGQEVIDALRAEDATILPGLPSHEIGYWNPSIETNDQGEATIEITVPERSTAWKFLAKGITTDTLAGDAEAQMIAAKDLFGDLKLPMAFVDGDQVDIIATVQQSKAKKDQQVTVTLKTTIGDKTAQQSRQIDAKEGSQQIAFKTKLDRPAELNADADGMVRFELIVSAGETQDVQQRTVPLEPYGLPVFGTASGTASSDTTAWVQLPENMPAGSPRLQIVVGPTIEQGLLDVLFGPSLRCGTVNGLFTSAQDTTSSDLMAAIALQQLFERTRDAESPQAAAIDTRIRSSISALISSQRDDGAWGWSGVGGSVDRYVSARAVWALSLARNAGYRVPDDAMNRAIALLESQSAKTAVADYESKAILLHATTVAGKPDFPMANRLYRNRQSMSNAALLYLAMAMAKMDRESLAGELITIVAARGIDEPNPRRRSAQSSLPWSHATAELRAIYALALQSVRPRDAKVRETVDWLLANRVGNRWNPDKATGPATLAACNWYARTKFETERYKLTVFVNDRQLQELDFDQHARTQTIDVPGELLKNGKQRVNFRLQGRGRFSYQCVMEGFVAADRLKSTTQDWRVTRFYEAAPIERDGRAIPRGFDVVDGGYASFRNQITQLPVARKGHVTLQIQRNGIRSDVPEEHLEYLVVTEPLPSGVTVIEDSIRGGFERFEIGAGAITFYIGNRRYVSNISYDMHGYLPGEYHVAPPVLRDAYRPDLLATTAAGSLAVLPIGQNSEDAYKLTPRELFELGKWHYGREELTDTAKYLKPLMDGWKLKPDFYKQSTEMLLNAHLEIGPPNEVVYHFEAIKERWPEIEIPYSKILKIGDAYHDMGEYERAYLIFRGTVESSFLTDSQVAGFLHSQDELLRSVDVMSSLIRAYPPEPYVAAATFDLAQQVYAMAPLASTKPCLREQKLTRVDLTKRALMMLNGFLTAYPEDPGADQAAFSMATALLELDQYQRAIDSCKRYVLRYPDSSDVDGFWYTIGFCHFALGQHQEALDVCGKVVDMKVKNPQTGRLAESQNRYRAIYILGQIHHSLGQAARAIEQYTRVSERFADAKEAISYFTRRDISLPEVSTVEPGKPVELELAFRNIPKCEAKVYRIDLMKFSLLRRNLQGITNINLAGIKPHFEKEIELGDGNDYRDRKRTLSLPLKEEGAYLVVCRGDDRHTSGLVLVSPLAIDIQEDTTSGRVRAIVKDRTTDKYHSDVHVKVIGSSNADFVSGDTDLRGIFVADGIQGTSTVIAQTDGGRYAFYRGTQHLGAPPQPKMATEPQAQQSEGEEAAQKVGKDQLLEGIYGRNSDINRYNYKRQQEQLYNENSGVQVEIVK